MAEENVKPNPEVGEGEEPSMEEILSSIRKIISDDDEEPNQNSEEIPVEAAAEEVKEEAPKEEAEAAAPAKEDVSAEGDEVLDLEQPIEENEAAADLGQDSIDDLFNDAPEAVEEKTENSVEESETPDTSLSEDENLISNDTMEKSVEALTGLHNEVKQLSSNMLLGQSTLEDIVRESLKPMLKDWLDQNLSQLIEKIVRQEIKNIIDRT